MKEELVPDYGDSVKVSKPPGSVNYNSLLSNIELGARFSTEKDNTVPIRLRYIIGEITNGRQKETFNEKIEHLEIDCLYVLKGLSTDILEKVFLAIIVGTIPLSNKNCDIFNYIVTFQVTNFIHVTRTFRRICERKACPRSDYNIEIS